MRTGRVPLHPLLHSMHRSAGLPPSSLILPLGLWGRELDSGGLTAPLRSPSAVSSLGRSPSRGGTQAALSFCSKAFQVPAFPLGRRKRVVASRRRIKKLQGALPLSAGAGQLRPAMGCVPVYRAALQFAVKPRRSATLRRPPIPMCLRCSPGQPGRDANPPQTLQVIRNR